MPLNWSDCYPKEWQRKPAAADVETRGSGLVIRGSRYPNAAGTGPLPVVITGKEAIGAMVLTIVEAPDDIVGRSRGYYLRVLGT